MTDFQVVSPSFPYLVFCVLPISDDALFHFKTKIDFNVYTLAFDNTIFAALATAAAALDCVIRERWIVFRIAFFILKRFSAPNKHCMWVKIGHIHHIFDVHIFQWRM